MDLNLYLGLDPSLVLVLVLVLFLVLDFSSFLLCTRNRFQRESANLLFLIAISLARSSCSKASRIIEI
jgi:hypothetical protein